MTAVIWVLLAFIWNATAGQIAIIPDEQKEKSRQPPKGLAAECDPSTALKLFCQRVGLFQRTALIEGLALIERRFIVIKEVAERLPALTRQPCAG
jgi:hypothetical protein